MHGVVVHLLPVLAAEKSKTPFYIAGGALATWAVVVSLGLGLRRPDFPGNATGQRLVIAVSAILVVVVMSTAVLTAGEPSKAKAAAAPAGTPTAAAGTPAASAGTPTAAAGTPAASAGTIALAADPTGQIRFDKQTLTAPAGKVTVALANASSILHNVAVTTASGSVLGATPVKLGPATLTLNLKPGTYGFVCQVHPTMKGTLTVT